MPGDSGATVVTNARVYYPPRAAAGASGTRHSPLPSWGSAAPSLGEGYMHNPGATCRGNAKVHLAVMYGRPPLGKSIFGISASESGSGHVYGLEKRPLTAGPDGERGSNSNHCGAL